MANIRIMTWNINHFSGNNKYAGSKTAYLIKILTRHRPDVLIVQEVNGTGDPFTDRFRLTIGNDVYTVHMGPLMKLVGSLNRRVDGTQYEYYPVLVRQTVSLERIYSIMPGQAGDRTTRDVNRTRHVITDNLSSRSLLEWPLNRPILMYVMQFRGTTFELGNVHTSPSWDPVLTARDYVDALTILDDRARASSERPVILGGDWYIGASSMVLDWRNNARKSFDTFLREHGFAVTRLKTSKDRQNAWTNFPHKGDGQAADFFMAKGAKATRTNGCLPKYGKVYTDWTASKNARVSDHAPVYIDYDLSPARSRSTSPMDVDSGSDLSSVPEPVAVPQVQRITATRVLRRKRSDWSVPTIPQTEPKKSTSKRSSAPPRASRYPQFTRMRVDKDGNCLFASIAMADGYRYGDAADYRRYVVDHMRGSTYYAERNGYTNNMAGFNAYLDNMAMDGWWGSDTEIEAFTNMLQREIRINFETGALPEVHAPYAAGQFPPLNVVLANHHFEPLLPASMATGIIEEEDEDD